MPSAQTSSLTTIFVVDDNAFFRVGLREILRSAGYVVVEAQNGKDALSKMTRLLPDLIISDINMPVMDGYMFYQEVRKHPEWVGIPFIFLTAYSEPKDVVIGKKLGVEDYLTKPIDYDELLGSVQAKLARFRELKFIQLQQAYEASLTMLANSIEVRDSYTRGHVERVTAYAEALGQSLGWPQHEINILRFGAILHDVGKVQIRDEILRKPGPLTAVERREMRAHPIIGAKMLARIPFLQAAVPIVRHHHERWDGRGYPDGLAGNAIPMGARIVCLVDAFDAITTTRSYRAGRSFDIGKSELTRAAGKMFDPNLVALFLELDRQGVVQKISDEWTPLEDLPKA
ncbi:MAG: response regulator [Anaerolineales bacterium]